MNWWESEANVFATCCSTRLSPTQLKKKTQFPLHYAIEQGREDVVFLFLLEHDIDLKVHIDQRDENGRLPLDLALAHRHVAIATTLVGHNCDVNSPGKAYKT